MNAPKVYAYTRFSTPEQAAGDSSRRQGDMAARWLAQHPEMVLDTELKMTDLGVSGYSGANLDNEKALGGFIRGIEDGVVAKGSVLLLEKLDRGTRLPGDMAIALFSKIIRAGVDIVVLLTGKRWTVEMLGGFDFIMMACEVVLANQESKGKSVRVREAKATRVSEARADPKKASLTREVPAWITRDGLKKLIPERAKIVKEIFTKFVSGTGKHTITAQLNARSERLWLKGKRTPKCWHRSYVTKILSNPAVIGRLTLHTVYGVAVAPIENYFPAVLKDDDRDLWDRAQSIIGSGRTRIVSKVVANLFATLARCPLCGGTMTRVVKGNGSEPKLICAASKFKAPEIPGKPRKVRKALKHPEAAKAAAEKGFMRCTRHAVSLAAVQLALINSASNPWPSKTAGLDTAMKEAQAAEAATLGMIDNVVDQIARRPSKALEAKLAVLEAQRDKIQADLAELHKQSTASETRLLKMREQRYRDALTAVPFDAAKANMVLRECLDHVVIDYGQSMLRLKWKHNGETAISYEEFPDLGPVVAGN